MPETPVALEGLTNNLPYAIQKRGVVFVCGVSSGNRQPQSAEESVCPGLSRCKGGKVFTVRPLIVVGVFFVP